MATESEIKQFLADRVESELLYIWGEQEIELGEQFKLAQARIT